MGLGVSMSRHCYSSRGQEKVMSHREIYEVKAKKAVISIMIPPLGPVFCLFMDNSHLFPHLCPQRAGSTFLSGTLPERCSSTDMQAKGLIATVTPSTKPRSGRDSPLQPALGLDPHRCRGRRVLWSPLHSHCIWMHTGGRVSRGSIDTCWLHKSTMSAPGPQHKCLFLSTN